MRLVLSYADQDIGCQDRKDGYEHYTFSIMKI